MFKQKTFLASCAFCLIGFVALGTSPVWAIQIQEKEIAQGDGDPTEVSTEERLLAAKQLADEEKAVTKEDDIANITAEGDFEIPTYLLPVAKESTQTATASAGTEPVDKPIRPSVSTPKPQNIQTQTITRTQTTRELPVVMIKQTELIPVAEQMEVERQLTGSTAQTRKIYEEALKRQQGASNQNTPNDNHKNVKTVRSAALQKQGRTIATDIEIDDILSDSNEITATDNNTVKKTLLLPLKPQKNAPIADINESTSKPIRKTFSSAYADKVLSAAQKETKLPLIMPQDLKVSFYPNAADFSGQTVKWIKAFSLRALQDPRTIIEIRLSRQNPALQQKRLYVIQRILANTGLSTHQMAVDYVDRPTDSLILRTVKKAETISTVRSQTSSGQTKKKTTINW